MTEHLPAAKAIDGLTAKLGVMDDDGGSGNEGTEMSAPQKGVSRGVAWSVAPMNAHEAALAAEGCQPLANIGDLCERFGSASGHRHQ